MAKKTSRPGRTLLIFFLGVAVMYGIVALGGATAKKSDPSAWKPLLGLDLQGGTRITLTAGGKAPGATKLKEAADIIRKRVNGNGVTESTVATQSNKNIVVEIPGKNRQDLVNSVKRTAQLRFRLVYGQPQPGVPATAPTKSPSASPTGTSTPSGKATSKTTKAPSVNQQPTATPKPRPAPEFADAKPSKKATNKPGKKATKTPAKTPAKTPTKAATTPAAPTAPTKLGACTEPATDTTAQALAWAKSPPATCLADYAAFTCPAKGQTAKPVTDEPNKPLISCDSNGAKYLMSKAVIEGTELKTADSGLLNSSVVYGVNLTFKSDGRKTFADVTTAINGTGDLFAIVLDGKVLEAPQVSEGAILNGEAQITGNFTQKSSASLANSLKYGALPIKFNQPTVETIGPSLAGDQLSAGLLAGAIGLLIVMLYCLLYYRGLGLVVIASLLVAGATTYGAVLVLGKGAGFTLSLPGIAGLIVAVGITADSFIVYFERIRDEMRAGKSMRVAVEAGWVRARNTCLAADTVSLLASLILYIFAIDEVRGFAFALGVSTLIDLAVFFWFTKPMVTLAAKRTFFNSGHRFSGLSPETLGIDGDRAAHIVGGRA